MQHWTWQNRISRPGEPAVPILCRRMHRVFWVPKRYRSLIAATMDGRAFSQRQVAQRIGCDAGRLNHALRSMERMGILRLLTSRGCHGESRVRLSSDAVTGNVAATGTSVDQSGMREIDPGTVGATFGAGQDPSAVWEAWYSRLMAS